MEKTKKGWINWNPGDIFSEMWGHKNLIKQFTKREISERYKNSLLGILWSWIMPLIMLGVYTFVFGFVFKAKWKIQTVENTGEFALILFCGISLYNIFGDTMNRSPNMIASKPNYVKKVVFPLEIIPVSVMGSVLINFLMSLGILILGIIIIKGSISWTIILAPLVLIPMIMITLGFAWIFSALGVFIKDVGYITNILTMILIYMTPIFYPMEAVPESFRGIINYNPLAIIVTQWRDVIIFGKTPQIGMLLILYILGIVVMEVGYGWFKSVKGDFADII